MQQQTADYRKFDLTRFKRLGATVVIHFSALTVDVKYRSKIMICRHREPTTRRDGRDILEIVLIVVSSSRYLDYVRMLSLASTHARVALWAGQKMRREVHRASGKSPFKGVRGVF